MAGTVGGSVTERVIRVIAQTQRLPPESVTPDSTFADLKIDSLDGINVIFALEAEFNISIPDEEAKQLKSVREAVEGVEKLIAAGVSETGAA